MCDYTIRIDRIGGLWVLDEIDLTVGSGQYLPGPFQDVLDGLLSVATCCFVAETA